MLAIVVVGYTTRLRTRWERHCWQETGIDHNAYWQKTLVVTCTTPRVSAFDRSVDECLTPLLSTG